MRSLLLILVLGLSIGCQNTNWMQNGVPMRVPSPPTGSYQVPNQYSQLGSGAANISTASSLQPLSSSTTTLTTAPVGTSTAVQSATFTAPLGSPISSVPTTVNSSTARPPSFP